MRKVAYIIPGFSESNKQNAYKKIAGFFRKKGIRPVPVDISWKKGVMTDYVSQAMKRIKGKDVCLFGFSFGAMISLIASTKIKPRTLILCSLSPWFKEDIDATKKFFENDKKAKKFINTPSWRKQIIELYDYSFNELAKKIKCKTILLVETGKGTSVSVKRAKDAKMKIKNSKLVLVRGAKHNIRQKQWLSKIKEVISTL
ncbi:hypothetical protein JXB27_00775 [Candidatus Woesearchaeota archaeon]|nr:hypothetical protein [Candidatus Woesearchaeota archaeon]